MANSKVKSSFRPALRMQRVFERRLDIASLPRRNLQSKLNRECNKSGSKMLLR